MAATPTHQCQKKTNLTDGGTSAKGAKGITPEHIACIRESKANVSFMTLGRNKSGPAQVVFGNLYRFHGDMPITPIPPASAGGLLHLLDWNLTGEAGTRGRHDAEAQPIHRQACAEKSYHQKLTPRPQQKQPIRQMYG